jgi:hypothetical protein
MRACLVALAAALAAGCSTTHDPHAPRTVVAGEAGGEVQVQHGERLRIELPKVGSYAWTREEPETPVVIPQGPPEGDAWMFTPVRSGKQTLRFAMAQRTVTYDVTVPEESRSLSGWLRSVLRRDSGAAPASR